MLSLRYYVKQLRKTLSFLLKKCGFWIPDRLYLQMSYYLRTGKVLHLKNPRTFGEKIQWLKLYDRQSKYTILVDKYAVKEYVASVIGKEYVIPTLGVWDRPEDICFDELPRQFVLKTTHGGGGGGVIICKDKRQYNYKDLIKQLRSSLKDDIYRPLREWPYKDVRRRIIAEPYIDNRECPNHDLTDYKFYCFNGVPKFCQVIGERHTKETIDFFDMEWHHQDFCGLNPKARPADLVPYKPAHFDKMREFACKLSEGTIFSRVDLYDTIDGPLFGEITFYPASGMGGFTPSQYDITLGEMIKLPCQ